MVLVYCHQKVKIYKYSYNIYLIFSFIVYTYIVSQTVFLISSSGVPLAQRVSYLASHSSLFGPDGTVNYDYVITKILTALIVCQLAQGVFPMVHTLTNVEPIWLMLQNTS